MHVIQLLIFFFLFSSFFSQRRVRGGNLGNMHIEALYTQVWTWWLGEEKKKRKKEEEEEFFFFIALFNPDRARSKHVLPSFNFLSLCERKEGKKEEELSWTSSSWENRTSKQRAEYVHSRPKGGLTRNFSSLFHPSCYLHTYFFHHIYFSGRTREKELCERASASERAMTTDVVAALVTEQIPRKERFLTVRQKKTARSQFFSSYFADQVFFFSNKIIIVLIIIGFFIKLSNGNIHYYVNHAL